MKKYRFNIHCITGTDRYCNIVLGDHTFVIVRKRDTLSNFCRIIASGTKQEMYAYAEANPFDHRNGSVWLIVAKTKRNGEPDFSRINHVECLNRSQEDIARTDRIIDKFPGLRERNEAFRRSE